MEFVDQLPKVAMKQRPKQAALFEAPKKAKRPARKIAELSARRTGPNSSAGPFNSPRQLRTAEALLSGRWIRREEIDRIAGSSNGPDVISRLRDQLGGESIKTRRVQVLDRDGRWSTPGEYQLTEEGRETLSNLLNMAKKASGEVAGRVQR